MVTPPPRAEEWLTECKKRKWPPSDPLLLYLSHLSALSLSQDDFLLLIMTLVIHRFCGILFSRSSCSRPDEQTQETIRDLVWRMKKQTRAASSSLTQFIVTTVDGAFIFISSTVLSTKAENRFDFITVSWLNWVEILDCGFYYSPYFEK